MRTVSRTNQGTTGTPGTGGAAAGTAQPADPVQVSIGDLITPVAGSTRLRVMGSVTVRGNEPVTDLTVRLEVGRKLTTREELDRLAAGGTLQRGLNFQHVDSDPLATPTAGAPTGFTEEADVAPILGSGGFGVRPVLVRVLGRVGGGSLETVGSATTFMVWSPTDLAQQTAVATVLPVASQPRLRSDGLLTDNTLVAEIRPGGRLYNLLDPVVLADPGARPVALAVDPTLVQALKVMQRPYRYASPDGEKTEPVPSPEATDFLDRIRDFAAAGGTVFALPYGDADLPALVHADQLDTVVEAVNTGKLIIAELLGRPVETTGTIAFPAGGIADAETVGLLRSLGAETVILDDRLLPGDPSVPYTPSAATTLPTPAGDIRALAADNRLAAVVAHHRDSDSQALALARFRAELAMITAERPDRQRMVVLAPPHDLDAPVNWLLEILNDLATSTYADPVGLDWPRSATAAPAQLRPALTYPPEARAMELPVDYISGVEEIRDEVWVLGSVFCPSTVLTGQPLEACRQSASNPVNPMRNTLLTAMSAAWRGAARPGGVSIAQETDGRATEYRASIRVVASRIVNLTSSRGRVPVTLENNTDREVTVVLALSSTDRSRLVSDTEVTRTLVPMQKDQIEIEVDAESAGTFPVDIRLKTVEGRALGPDAAARVLVRSTVYGAIATAITIGAVGVLMLAVVIRLVRKVRGRGRTGTAPTESKTSDSDSPGAAAHSRSTPFDSPGAAAGSGGDTYSDGPYAGGPYADGPDADGSYADAPYADAYADSSYADDPSPDGPYADDTYADDTYGNGTYGEGAYAHDAHGTGDTGAGPWSGRAATPAGATSQPRRRDGR